MRANCGGAKFNVTEGNDPAVKWFPETAHRQQMTLPVRPELDWHAVCRQISEQKLAWVRGGRRCGQPIQDTAMT